MDSLDNIDQYSQSAQQPTTSRLTGPNNKHTGHDKQENQSDKSDYQVKCKLLEYHIEEAILVGKALRAELKQYRDKVEFEKKLQRYLTNRVRDSEQ